MAKPTTVKVVPNPFIAIAHDGVPQGAVGYPGSRGYIGAHLDHVLSNESGTTRLYFPKWPDRSYEMQLDATIANAVREGSLIAADEESARKIGITDKEFLPLAEAIAAEKKKAEEYWTSAYGKDATIQDVPTEATVREEPGDASEQNPATPQQKSKLPPSKLLRKGETVLSGTQSDPHVVLAPNKE